jgi:hypothetical protein
MTGNKRRRVQDWNNRTRVQDWKELKRGSRLGTTEQGLRTGNNRTRTEDWEPHRRRGGEERGHHGLGPAGNWYTPKKRMVST